MGWYGPLLLLRKMDDVTADRVRLRAKSLVSANIAPFFAGAMGSGGEAKQAKRRSEGASVLSQLHLLVRNQGRPCL